MGQRPAPKTRTRDRCHHRSLKMIVRCLVCRRIPSNAVCHMHIHECSVMSVCTREHCLQYPRAPRSIAEPRDVVRSANCLIAMVCLSQFLGWSRCAHTMYACFTIRKYSLGSNRHSRTVCRAQSCRPIVIIIRFVHAFSLCFDWFLPARALHLYRSRVRPGGVRSVFCRYLFVFPGRHRSRFRSRSFRCRVVYVFIVDSIVSFGSRSVSSPLSSQYFHISGRSRFSFDFEYPSPDHTLDLSRYRFVHIPITHSHRPSPTDVYIQQQLVSAHSSY